MIVLDLESHHLARSFILELSTQSLWSAHSLLATFSVVLLVQALILNVAEQASAHRLFKQACNSFYCQGTREVQARRQDIRGRLRDSLPGNQHPH